MRSVGSRVELQQSRQDQPLCSSLCLLPFLTSRCLLTWTSVVWFVIAFEARFLSVENSKLGYEDAEMVPDLTQLSEDTFFPERILAERINNITHGVEYQIQWRQSPHMEEANGPDISWSATATEEQRAAFAHRAPGRG